MNRIQIGRRNRLLWKLQGNLLLRQLKRHVRSQGNQIEVIWLFHLPHQAERLIKKRLIVDPHAQLAILRKARLINIICKAHVRENHIAVPVFFVVTMDGERCIVLVRENRRQRIILIVPIANKGTARRNWVHRGIKQKLRIRTISIRRLLNQVRKIETLIQKRIDVRRDFVAPNLLANHKILQRLHLNHNQVLALQNPF